MKSIILLLFLFRIEINFLCNIDWFIIILQLKLLDLNIINYTSLRVFSKNVKYYKFSTYYFSKILPNFSKKYYISILILVPIDIDLKNSLPKNLL